jgi:oligopeptide/dipeptide ABC transporter ATP-binding protein
MESLIREHDRSALMITHDLGVIAEVADRVCVMYAGAIMESGPVGSLFKDPQHPYTIGLLGSLPTPGRKVFTSIPGNVPNLANLPGGCRFHPRCPRAQDLCALEDPGMSGTDSTEVRCHFPGREHGDLVRSLAAVV